MRYKLNGLGKFIEVKRDFDIVAYFFCDRCDPQIKLQAAIDKVKAL